MIQTTVLPDIAAQVDPVFLKRFEELLELCHTTLAQTDDDMLRRAFMAAYYAHRNDKRASGEPYISHPLEVARIVAEDISLDDLSVAAAILHDVVEDTDLSLDYIREEFGDQLASVIDGLTKISGVFESRELGQAENVRKLMLSMASDIRVILVKFADRLHNMRTLESLPPEKQIKIATETRDLFAPLAHRFGLFKVKSELEDLSLKVLDPEQYYAIVAELKATKAERENMIKQFVEPLVQRLQENNLVCDIYGRPKNIYSIYRKMVRQNKPIDQIFDKHAIRIVIKGDERTGRQDCWRAYSIVTDLYKPIPERFRDFISVPKSNGYQSLHTTVVGNEGRRFEVQIRTQGMHEIAERGVAAHWKYKEGVQGGNRQFDRWLHWVRELLDAPKAERATEFVNEFRLNLYDEEIYVFTPNGDLLSLPAGATPVDFAFQVHTQVGFHCIGAKVNGKMMPLSYRLKSGDQVEIITSKKQTPNPDWIKFVVTQKARSRIRQWANERRRQVVEHGKDVWEKKLKRARMELDEQDVNRYVSRLKFKNPQEMFYEIGSGNFDPEHFIRLVRSGMAKAAAEKEGTEAVDQRKEYESFVDQAHSTARPALMIDGELHTDIRTQYATCCNPIPGDDVFGYVSRSEGIKIHRLNCRNAPNLLINHPDRIVPVEWSRQKDVQFISALRVMGEDRVGIVSDITTVISKNLKTNIKSISVNSDDGIFEGNMVVSVNDLEHLRRLMERLKQIDGIHGVYRYEE